MQVTITVDDFKESVVHARKQGSRDLLICEECIVARILRQQLKKEYHFSGSSYYYQWEDEKGRKNGTAYIEAPPEVREVAGIWDNIVLNHRDMHPYMERLYELLPLTFDVIDNKETAPSIEF